MCTLEHCGSRARAGRGSENIQGYGAGRAVAFELFIFQAGRTVAFELFIFQTGRASGRPKNFQIWHGVPGQLIF
jgi:hypothetical protein